MGANWAQGLTNLSQGLGALAGYYGRREEMDAEAERQARRDAANRDFERAMQSARLEADDKREGRAVEREQIRAGLETSRQEILEKKADQTFELTKAAREEAAGARADANATRNDALEESRLKRETEVAKGIFDAAKSVEATLAQQELASFEKWVTNNKPDFKNIVGEKAKVAARAAWDQEQQEARKMYAEMYKGMREEARTAREAAQERYSSYGGEKIKGAVDSGKTASGGEPTRLALKVGDYKTPQELEAEIVKQVSGSPVDPMVIGEAIRESGLYKDLPEMTAALHRVRDAVKPGAKAAPAPTTPPAAAPAAPERTTAPAIPPPKPTAAAPAAAPAAPSAAPELIEDPQVAAMRSWAKSQTPAPTAPSAPRVAKEDLIVEDSGLPKSVVQQIRAAGVDASDSRSAAKKKLTEAGMTEQQFAAFWKDIRAYLNKGTLTG